MRIRVHTAYLHANALIITYCNLFIPVHTWKMSILTQFTNNFSFKIITKKLHERSKVYQLRKLRNVNQKIFWTFRNWSVNSTFSSLRKITQHCGRCYARFLGILVSAEIIRENPRMLHRKRQEHYADYLQWTTTPAGLMHYFRIKIN